MPTNILRSLAFALLLLASLATQVAAQDSGDTDNTGDRVWHHAGALIGEPKYGPDFTHFDYVNPDAPKGGIVRLSEQGGFDTFNPILPEGEVASGLGLVYESLMTPSLDEVSTDYGLLAESFSYPDDFSSVTYRLKPNARWQDGQPVTPEDVVWSFNKLIEINPNRAQYYHNVTDVEVTGERDVTFHFDSTGNRELPKIVGQVTVLPKHWWEGKDADGKQRDIARSTLERPMGSGPYKIGEFTAGRTVSYERDPNYWGADEPVNIGSNNFDTIRYEYFRDNTVEFEAFKGDQFDWWLELVARRWATGYDFPAVEQGKIVKERYENPYRSSGLMVGFIPNLRREKFQDERVREALNYAFDFETLQRDLFYGEYDRINSYFFRTELASSGLPQGEELDILNSVKDEVPAQVFSQEYTNPVGGSPEKLRANLRQALGLLNEAGYTLQGNRLVDGNGEQLSFEILLNGPTIEPVALAFQQNLKLIGIDASVRTVDSPQYINRVRSRDFDMIYNGWVQSLSPGNEQRFFWGSEAANAENSSNYAGISDPGVDDLIDKIIYADDRTTLIAATHALDRVLLAHHYVIPTYGAVDQRIAFWNRFDHPEKLPEYAIGFPEIWWYDPQKADAIK